MGEQISDRFNPSRQLKVNEDGSLDTNLVVDSSVISSSHPLPVNLIGNDNVARTNLEGGGKISVGTSSVEVIFSGTTNSIVITADISNTGILYVGKSNISSVGSNAFVFLYAGDEVIIDYNNNFNPIYVVSNSASQNFWKGALL